MIKREENVPDKVNARELALGILLDVTKDGEYSHIAVANVLGKYQYLDKKDRAFITRIAEGTLENLIQINYVIDQFSKVPASKMKPVIRCIIQSAAYQILFMDAVPDSAACNEAVRLAKKKGFRNLGGFVNGVLRSVSRGRGQVRWPDQDREPELYLSVRYSVPEWMVRMWKEEFAYDWGNAQQFQDMERMLQAFLEPAPVTVRTDTGRCTPQELKRKLEAEGVNAVISEELPYALQITGYDYLGALQSFREGLFYVQDISSMLVAQAAAPREGDFVLDVCAAPGGKAIHIAQMMHGTGHVLARDLTEYKAGLLAENMRRCQVRNMEAQVWDARIFDEPLAGKADIVIADLPCSGLGVMRKKKDIRYKMTPEKMEELARLQREILSAVCHYVKPGGKLVYSTCTIHWEENEGNAQWFARQFPDFKLVRSRQILPERAQGHSFGRDGFYIAQFRREKG